MSAYIEFNILKELTNNFMNNMKTVYVFGHKVSEVFLIDKNDTVFGFGQNEFGVLGFGHNRQVNKPQRVEELSGKGIVTFVNGYKHVIGLTNKGQIFSWGRNDFSQLGNGIRNKYFNKPEINQCLINEVVVDIGCGGYHSVVLTEKNELFVWGSNDFGQIGNGSEDLFQLTPYKLKAFNGENIIAISCGFHHSIALTDKGFVYGWGHNDSGQLGCEETGVIYNNFRTRDLKVNEPKLIKSDVFVKKIYCGSKHSMLLSSEGDIYTFGDNTFGQIGNNNTVNQMTPQKISSLVKYKEIASHFRYDISIALTVDDILYVWGKVGKNVKRIPTESQFKSINNILMTYHKITYKSIQVLCDFGIISISSFGSERMKNKIPDNIRNEFIEIKDYSNHFSSLFSPNIIAKFRKQTRIKAHFSQNMKFSYYFYDRYDEWPHDKIERNALFVTENSSVHAIGSNGNRLSCYDCRNVINEPIIVKDLCDKGVVDFANGYQHMVARTDKNQLYIWGYNGLGQLGNETLDDCFVPQLVKRLSQENIVDMCCGIWHTMALTDRGELYVWGGNKFGQIGNESDYNCQSTPFKITQFNEQKIIAISCGAHHSMALTESGRVYGWGRNDSGQLGSTNIKGSNKPERIRLKNNDGKKLKMKKICCGYNYSLLLTCEGDIYGFGSNSFGQLANNCFKSNLNPTKIINENEFIDIASHYDCVLSAALSVDNIYYIWGDCGQEITTEPKATNFDSFNNIFQYYKGITHKRAQNETNYDKNFLLSIQKDNNYKKNFKELGPISFGGCGIVSKAKNKNGSECYAIKRMAFNVKQKDLVLREIKINSQLNCPYIVKVKTVWIEENYMLKEGHQKYNDLAIKSLSQHKLFDPRNDLLLHIQMEWCDKSLRETIKMISDELNSNHNQLMTQIHYYILSELFIEILQSVDYLHNLIPPVIHRDLKPDNILITRGVDGKFVKICDFGFAKLHEFDGQSHSFVGTFRYMAPEVLRAQKYNTKADIFSIGFLINEWIEGFKLQIERNPEMACFEKYENLSALMVLMMKEQDLRPNCKSILNQKNSWALSIKDIGDELQLEEIRNKLSGIENCFYLPFLKNKLEILK